MLSYHSPFSLPTMRFSLTFATLATALCATAACSGDKRADTHLAESTASTSASTPSSADAAAPVATAGAASNVRGQELYARCVACHQQNGDGVPGAFPPLAGSEWVTGPASRPIAILLHGLQGDITVRGVPYNSMMLAYGTGQAMTDDEVASVLSYVRASFGNTSPSVTVDEVAKVRIATAGRTTPMTMKELQALQ